MVGRALVPAASTRSSTSTRILDGDPAVVLDGQRVSKLDGAVELRWLADSKRLCFGTVTPAGAVVWREVTAPAGR